MWNATYLQNSIESEKSQVSILKDFATKLSIVARKEDPVSLFNLYLFFADKILFIPQKYPWNEQKQRPDKIPCTKWSEWKDVVSESKKWLERIKHSFEEGKHNFGTAIKVESIGIVAIDVDDREKFREFTGMDDEEYLEDVKKDAYLINKSMCRGYHFYVHGALKEKVLELSRLAKNSELRDKYGFEIKAQDLLVVPPSRAVHEGKVYECKILFVNPGNVEKQKPESEVMKRILSLVDEYRELKKIEEEKRIKEKFERKASFERREFSDLREIIDEVKKRVKFSDILGTPKKDYGDYYTYLCPFHANDRNPSFSVRRYGDYEYAVCWHDREGFDVIKFYEVYYKCDFITALKELCKEAGIEFPERKKKSRKEKELFITGEEYHEVSEGEKLIKLEKRIDEWKAGLNEEKRQLLDKLFLIALIFRRYNFQVLSKVLLYHLKEWGITEKDGLESFLLSIALKFKRHVNKWEFERWIESIPKILEEEIDVDLDKMTWSLPESERELYNQVVNAIVVFLIDDVFYLAEGGFWKAVEVKAKEIRDVSTLKLVRHRICPFFTFKESFVTEDKEYVFCVENATGEEMILRSLEKKDVNRILRGKIEKEVFFNSLVNVLLQKIKDKKLFRRCGWVKTDNGVFFLHPAIEIDKNVEGKGIKQLLDVSEEDVSFEPRNVKKMHEVVLDLLEEGRLAGVKIAFAVASLFLRAGFTVIDTGFSGKGKTLTSRLATNCFYNRFLQMTTWATKVALELTLAKFQNLPILFDEGALTEDSKIQDLIFIIQSGTGKSRGTRNLSVRLSKIKSVCFVTNEREFDFNRVGAYRRFLQLTPRDWEDYTARYTVQDIARIVETCWGCGVDWIKFLLEKCKDDPTMSSIDYEMVDPFPAFQGFYKSVVKAVSLLESYYDRSFGNLKEKIDEIFRKQAGVFEEHDFDHFYEYFIEYVVRHSNNFIIKRTERVQRGEEIKVITVDIEPRGEIWGIIDETFTPAYIYILTSVFKKFCEEHGIATRQFIDEADARGLMYHEKTRKRILKKINGSTVSCYCFIGKRPKEDSEKES